MDRANLRGLLTTIKPMPPWKGGKEMSDQDSISWSELAELTHETQVERFGWCSCEDTEIHEYPYPDCIKTQM
jgi:hypothetical protein